MKKYFIGILILIVGLFYITRPYLSQKKSTIVQQSMKLTSAAFENNAKIPVKFTCDGLPAQTGEKIHPPLSISNVPVGAKSLVFIVDDPDAPSGVFNHWIIWNIRPDVTTIPEGKIPEKSQEGTNSAEQVGYAALCPPAGQHHRYFFTLYALDTSLGIDGKAKKSDVEKSMVGHIMAQSLLVGVY